jgi:hypothetical protein
MKKIFNHKTVWMTALAGILTATSCTKDFDEMNTSPNSPTAIGPQYLLPTGNRNGDRPLLGTPDPFRAYQH